MNKSKRRMRDNKGSLTFETAVCLPVFMFCMYAFIVFCRIIAVRTVIYEAAAVEASEYLAEYAYLSEKEDALQYSNIFVANEKIDDYIDDKELVERYISGGISGIKLTGTGIPDENGMIRLTVRYKVRFYIPILGSFEKTYSDTVRQKAYIGYKGTDEEEDSPDEIYVYVAENGEVYHHSRGCTYLYHHTSLMRRNTAENSGYEPCSYCHASTSGSYVFVTGDGEKYHSSPNCSRLLRTVRRVKLSEVGGLPECHKCR